MGVPAIETGPMTIEDFLRFTDARPDDEKWELLEGDPVLNATPSFRHQRIAANILGHLVALETAQPRDWAVAPGIGVKVAGASLPVPDILLRPSTPPAGDAASRECDDVIVAFEVLSPSTAGRDLRWKRRAYSDLPTLTHYVVVAQDAVDVVVFARDDGFSERRLRSLDRAIDLPRLGISIPLAVVYRTIELESP